VKRGSTSRAGRAARAGYARATLNTRAVLADPEASAMDRYRAAAAEEAAARAAAQAEPELEAEL
jgi:hypothetical protein